MLSVKREKILGLAFTIAAAVIFIGLYIVALVYVLTSQATVSIEGLTLMGLQTFAFVFLILGMIFHKENWILGTLVGALVASAVSYLIDDVTHVVKKGIDFTAAWYLPASDLTLFVAHGLLTCGTVAFLIFLISGRHARSRALASAFFMPYLAIDILGLIFLIIGTTADSSEFASLFSAATDFLACFAYIVDIRAYFFHRKDGSLIEDTASPELRKAQKEESQKAVASLDEVIASYRKNVLSSTFEKKDGRVVLTVDLTSAPLYEDCSKETLLNSSVYSYVEDVAFALAEGEALSLRFLYPEGTNEETKAKVETIFKAHYAICYKNCRDKLTKTMIIAITFVFIGFLLMTLHLPYVSSNPNSIYGEMLDIFGWVFTWEAVEMVCVSSFDNQKELRDYKSLYTAEVVKETPQAEAKKD